MIGPTTDDQLVEETEWIADSRWAWITFPADTGTFQVEVRVRDGRHAGLESYDDRKTVEYTQIAAS